MKNVLAILMTVAAMPSAQAQSGVDWTRFGLQDVAQTAECAARRMPSQFSMDVLATYWGPPLQVNGSCVVSGTTVSKDTVNRARQSLLPALSACLGTSVADDSAPGIRRIAYATAVIAANGIYSHEAQRSRLDEYIERTRRCQQ